MTEWQSMTLQQAGVVLIDCVHATPLPVQRGYPYVAIPQMKNGHIDFSEARQISTADFEIWTKKARPRLHDVVLSRRTNPGVTAVTRDGRDFALGQNLVLLRADGRFVLPQFLRWLTRSPVWWEQIEKFMNVGAVFNSLRCADVPKFLLPIPTKVEQARIAALLDDLDDKIELNRQMNETLEAMAQAIFRDWFVDFGPTRRKMEGTADPVKIMGDLTTDAERARHLAELFPAKLGDEGLPEGWTAGDLGQYADLNTESWSARTTPGELEYIDLSNTKWGTIENTTIYTWAQAPSRARRVLRVGDTIVGTVRPGNGSYAYVGRNGLTGSTGFAVLRPMNPEFSELIYCAATARDNIERLEKLADGGAYPAVRPDVVLSTPAPTVPLELVAGFSKIASSLLGKVEHNKRETQTLSATRDLLLPKLMSGEIRLHEAEEQLEAAE